MTDGGLFAAVFVSRSDRPMPDARCHPKLHTCHLKLHDRSFSAEAQGCLRMQAYDATVERGPLDA